MEINTPNSFNEDDISILQSPTEDDFSEIEFDDPNLSQDQKALIQLWTQKIIEKKDFPEKEFQYLIDSDNNESIKKYVELVNAWETAKKEAINAFMTIGKRALIHNLKNQ